MVESCYIPDCGDIVWMSLNPQAGHEQAGHRPALVLSPQSYNAKLGLCLIMPVTNQSKGYPFELALPAHCQTTGVVLCDQMKSLDWKARATIFKEKVGLDFARLARDQFMPLLTW